MSFPRNPTVGQISSDRRWQWNGFGWLPFRPNALASDALANVPTGPDLVPYFIGIGLATSTPFTALARSLLAGNTILDMQTTLDLVPDVGIQAFRPDLLAISLLTGTGMLTRIGTHTWALRQLTQPAAGITVTNPQGIAGDYTLVLANDLAAVEGLATTGLVRRSATDTWVAGTTVAYSEIQNVAAVSVFGRSANSSGVGDNISAGFDDRLLTRTGSTLAFTQLTPGMFPATLLDTDTSLTANSDARIASQKATKAYIDALLTATDAMVFKGVIDCSGNPNYPAASEGWTYRVSVAGKIGGVSGPNVEVGDIVLCITANAGGSQAGVGVDWGIIQANIDGAVVGPASSTDGDFAQYNGATGKVIKDGGISFDTDGSLAANSASRVPAQSAVKTYVDTATAGASLTKTDDTNVTLTLGGLPSTSLLRAASITVGWAGTLAAGRLNANVVQAITNDTNVQGSITSQNLTLVWSGQLSIARGGTGQATKAAAFNALSPMTTLGDTEYFDGTNGVRLAGNTTTTRKFLRQAGTGSASAAPVWDTILASDVTLGAALTKTDDTNVTLSLGGTPTNALVNAASITVGWAGTLAAGRLNANVVQGVTNDTNVTGSISAQNLTLGWTGTLAAARLNANVVQAITNDTNIQGSISAQNLTLAWAGTLAAGRLNANVVQSVVNDTNVTGSIAAQALTLGWAGTLGVGRGGTGTGTAFTQGSVIYAGASGVYSQDNANHFWDATNHRLGIQTASPSYALDVNDKARARSFLITSPLQTESVAPTANTLSTLTSMSVQGSAVSNTTREFLLNVGFTVGTGQGAAADGSRDKVGIYSGVVANSGAGDVWCINTDMLLSPSSGDYNAQGFELDFDNKNVHRGDAGFETYTAAGFSISGAGTKRSLAAMQVSGPGDGTSHTVTWSTDTATWAGHPFVVDDMVYFTTSGTLPTGLALNTFYYVVAVPLSSTFKVSATKGGSAISTSGGSGTHTAVQYRPIWNWGMVFANSCVNQITFYDLTNAGTSIRIDGVHNYCLDMANSATSSQIRLRNNTGIVWRNAAGNADKVALLADTSDQLNIGSSFTTVYTNAANVGFGTSNPLFGVGTGIQVTGAPGTIRLSSTAASGRTYELRSEQSGVGNAGFTLWDITGAAAVWTVNASQQMGIGTASPAGRLNVYSGDDLTNGILRVESSANAAMATFYALSAGDANSRNWAFQTNQTSYGDFAILRSTSRAGTPSTQVVTFDKNGNVGIGNTNPTSTLHVTGGVQIGAPTGGDKGANNVNIAGDIYKNNTAYTNPDYVFEQEYTGSITKFADSPGASGYKGRLSLQALRDFTRKYLRLPGFSDEPAGMFRRGDMALEKIEELALYIMELHERLAAFENK